MKARSNDVQVISLRRRRKDERPTQIACAALQVFSEKGFAATRLEDVADRAGVAKGTIYLYYSNKHDLFEAVVKDALSSVIGVVEDAVRSGDAGSEVLLRFAIESVYRAVIDTERREILRMLIAESARFPQLVDFYHREAVCSGRALLDEILRRGVADGEFRDCPATRVPEVIFGPAIFAAVWQLVFDDIEPLDRAGYLEAHLDMVLTAILT